MNIDNLVNTDTAPMNRLTPVGEENGITQIIASAASFVHSFIYAKKIELTNDEKQIENDRDVM